MISIVSCAWALNAAAQQNANEPEGRRWVRLLDELVDMYLAHFGKDPVRRHP